ncbi:elongation factor P [Blattabacterium cuenoti]|uniref:elongation factor P n=1 Tax=Blattabacterium cuenoti TaxID=1653831 RepID=UPI00163B8F77|nr:elongation factor P [Blattabacterium cuenoti]
MNIKKGLHIQWNKEVYKIIDFLHVKPGKGDVFIKTKLKNLVTGNILEYNFSSKNKLKKARIESYFYSFLYKKKNSFYFMNEINYDQIEIEKEAIKNNISFLKEGTRVTIFFHVKNEKEKIFLFLKMPTTIILKVKHTEFIKKGDTINNANKLAILETGAQLLVPSFIRIGEFIKINTENRYYMERIKR